MAFNGGRINGVRRFGHGAPDCFHSCRYIQCVGESSSYIDILIYAVSSLAPVDVLVGGAGLTVNGDIRIFHQTVIVFGTHAKDEIHVSGFQLDGTDGAVCKPFEGKSLGYGFFSPVVIVSLKHDAVACGPGNKFIRACSHGVSLIVAVGICGHLLADNLGRGKIHQDISPRAVQLHLHSVVIQRLAVLPVKGRPFGLGCRHSGKSFKVV